MIEFPSRGGRWARLKVKGLPQMRFDPARYKGFDLSSADIRTIRVVRCALRTEVQVVIRERAPEVIEQPVNPSI